MEKLSSKASQTIDEIRRGVFRPRKTQSRRGTHRLFAALPQFTFKTRYLPIDTQVLANLLSISLRKKGHSRQQRGEARATFTTEKRAEGWSHVFRLERLQGIKVPGMPVQEGKRQQVTPREFGFYMETDGVGCSFVCRRPLHAAPPQPPYTPETVPCNPKVIFKAIDPGVTDIVVGITPVLSRDIDDQGEW